MRDVRKEGGGGGVERRGRAVGVDVAGDVHFVRERAALGDVLPPPRGKEGMGGGNATSARSGRAGADARSEGAPRRAGPRRAVQGGAAGEVEAAAALRRRRRGWPGERAWMNSRNSGP